MSTTHQSPRPHTSASAFEWRAALGPWRWLLLGTLGVAPGACGGRAQPSNLDQSVADLEEPAGTALETPASPAGAGAAPSRGPTLPQGDPAPEVTRPQTPASASVASDCVPESTLEGNWERCTNGMLHRRELGSCTSALPRSGYSLKEALGYAPGADAGIQYECLTDEDCTAAPHGHCEFGQGGPYCAYGCLTDSECGDAQVCLCGPSIGECIAAECSVDSDCGGSYLCGSYESEPSCGGIRFGCQKPEDLCSGNADCTEGGFCVRELIYSYDSPQPPSEVPFRSCSTGFCIVGRPFLVDGAPRLAPSTARQDWYMGDPGTLPSSAAAAPLNAAVAQGWLEQALMEHASVASFARFSLQLLQLGAPAELVSAAAVAMQDEIRHARSCFELARRYSGEEVGPGPLAVEGALESSDPAAVVLAAVREGCIGETVAAIEASEALHHCEDAGARAVLERIAIEEGQHAELAWRFVAWALETRPELAPRVREAFAHDLAGAQPARRSGPQKLAAVDHDLARHGLLSAPLRAALRDRVLLEVVAPCVEGLLGGAGWQRPDASVDAKAHATAGRANPV